LAKVEDFNIENTEKVYRDLIEELQIKGGQLIHPTRLPLTGRTATPGLFEVMTLLG
jgi:glutamyl/glutaminyl-tRNA synthetase